MRLPKRAAPFFNCPPWQKVLISNLARRPTRPRPITDLHIGILNRFDSRNRIFLGERLVLAFHLPVH